MTADRILDFLESNLVVALVGAAAALLFTAARDYFVARKKRRDTASAFAWELRFFGRKVETDLAVAEKDHIVVFDPAFSDVLYETLLAELPDQGGNTFLAVRSAYSQVRQVAYLKGRLQERHEAPGVYPQDNLFDAYVASLKQARTRIAAALKELRSTAPAAVFEAALPTVTDLSAAEELIYRHVDRKT